MIIPTIGTPNESGRARFVDDAVHSLMEKETYATLEIIVVTTGVIPDVQVDIHGKHVLKHVVYDTQEFNFSEAINTGRAAATGDYLLLLNDDTTVAEPNPVTRMLEVGQIEGVGVVGCKLTYPDSRLQHVGIVLLPSGPTHCWIAKPGKEPGLLRLDADPAQLPRRDCGGHARAHGRVRPARRLRHRVRARLQRRRLLPAGARGRQSRSVDALRTLHPLRGRDDGTQEPGPGGAALFVGRWATAYPVDPYYSPALNQDLGRIYEAL